MSVEFNDINEAYGISFPWQVSGITTDQEAREVSLEVCCTDESVLTCPECERICPVYDRRSRQWRHLDTGDYHTYVVTDLPRVKCSEHEVRTIMVPWASRSARMRQW